ncbi:NADP oxidoreductase [Streptomyces roseoverticillatus]|uniref:NADPH-dependent F420 reductase n=1 Tax=Streptomyces roseoverticillatus TaxID=66429 RepID=UPI0033D45442
MAGLHPAEGGGARAHIAKLAGLGHEVHVGTRDPEATLARTEPDTMGTPPFAGFLAEHSGIALHTFGDAAAASDGLVISGIDGHNAVAALSAVADQLAGKTLIDYAVPYIYRHEPEHPWPTPWGIMPKLEPVDTDSLGEQIQRALPRTKVVKSFVTQEQSTVVNPDSVGGGDHTMFVAGEDAGAKQQATDLLKAYGWSDILDLGPLVAARGMEMYAHMHSAIGFGLGHQFGGHFGIKVVR